MGWLDVFLLIMLEIGATILSILFCSFFVILASHKKEIWAKIGRKKKDD